MKDNCVFFKVAALLLVAALILGGCDSVAPLPEFSDNANPITALHQDAIDGILSMQQHLAQEDISMKIYFLDYHVLTYSALSAEDLISSSMTDIIAVSSNHLWENADLLNALQRENIIPIGVCSTQNVRLCYVFETLELGRILTVAFNSSGLVFDSQGNADVVHTVLINGLEVQYDPVFYEIVRPFISYEMRDTFDSNFDYR